MNVLLFGASGRVGQGALRECLLDDTVTSILSVGRRPTGKKHDKLHEVTLTDPGDLAQVAEDLSVYDACFFCLGVSAAAMSETEYRKITYDLTLRVARFLAEKNPKTRFLYVSGAGTDSTEHGSAMWARVKGETENALLKLPFEQAYMLRPGIIRPLHGIRSSTLVYRIAYAALWPVLPILERLPKLATNTERLGKAMIVIARDGAPKPVLESIDLNNLVPR